MGKIKPFTKNLTIMIELEVVVPIYLNNNWFFNQNVKFLKFSNQFTSWTYLWISK